VNRTLALMYEKAGSYAQAIAMWDLVARADPQDREAARKAKDLAATHTIVKGNYEGVHQGTPGERLQGSREFQVGAPATGDAKIDPLRKKIEADPTNPNPYLQLANTQLRQGQLDEARQTLQQGLAATQNHFDLQLALGDLEITPFRSNLQIVEQKLKEKPKDAKLLQQRAALVKEINSLELASFRQRADRFPNELGHHLELGIRLLRAGQFDEAIQELQNARRDPRFRGKALLHLGHCFKLKKNMSLAKRNYGEALQALPAEEEEARKGVMFELASLAAEEKDWRAAIEMGNELANLDFGYQQIGQLVESWQENWKQAQMSR
jgi:tetratricopeptide (TPR) repeat protein